MRLVTDLDDIFVPQPEEIFVNLDDCRFAIASFFNTLPRAFWEFLTKAAAPSSSCATPASLLATIRWGGTQIVIYDIGGKASNIPGRRAFSSTASMCPRPRSIRNWLQTNIATANETAVQEACSRVVLHANVCVVMHVCVQSRMSEAPQAMSVVVQWITNSAFTNIQVARSSTTAQVRAQHRWTATWSALSRVIPVGSLQCVFAAARASVMIDSMSIFWSVRAIC